MSDTLTRLLEPGAMTPYGQAIVEVGPAGARIHSVEFLIRGPAGTPFEHPCVLFEYVRRKRAEPLVDMRTIALALQAARQLPIDIGLSINAHASSLGRNPRFAKEMIALVKAAAVNPTRVMLEIVEHSPAWNQKQFLANLEELRGAGLRIALDDIGTGQSNIAMMLDARPDCLKLDGYLAEGIAHNPMRRTVMASIQRMAEEMGCIVVAECIEESEDLAAVRDIGIKLVQGFIFSRPLPIAALSLQVAHIVQHGTELLAALRPARLPQSAPLAVDLWSGARHLVTPVPIIQGSVPISLFEPAREKLETKISAS